MTVDRHRAADTATYVFKTEDYGKTWKSIGAGIPKSVFGYARVVREDPRRKGMLYLGTENSLYVSLDDGATWMPLQNNLPHAPIGWLTVQEDFDDLVVATWGRGFWIMDDIGPLRQLTPAVIGERAHLFDPRPAFLFALQRSDDQRELPDRVRSAVARRPQPALWRVAHVLPEHACVERGACDDPRREGRDHPHADRYAGMPA